MEANENVVNDQNNKQPISKAEQLQIAYNFGKKGFVFPGKIMRGDWWCFIHDAARAFQKDKAEVCSKTENTKEIDEETMLDSVILQTFQSIFEFHNGKYYNLLKSELKELTSENMDETTKVRQILRAYEDGLYFPCACAVATLIEGTLGKAARSADTRLYELIKCVSPDSNHPEKELIRENLKGFISELAKSANFVSDQEPTFLNRHWLLHGRSEKEISKLDCLILLNALREILELIHGPSSVELQNDEEEEET